MCVPHTYCDIVDDIAARKFSIWTLMKILKLMVVNGRRERLRGLEEWQIVNVREVHGCSHRIWLSYSNFGRNFDQDMNKRTVTPNERPRLRQKQSIGVFRTGREHTYEPKGHHTIWSVDSRIYKLVGNFNSFSHYKHARDAPVTEIWWKVWSGMLDWSMKKKGGRSPDHVCTRLHGPQPSELQPWHDPWFQQDIKSPWREFFLLICPNHTVTDRGFYLENRMKKLRMFGSEGFDLFQPRTLGCRSDRISLKHHLNPDRDLSQTLSLAMEVSGPATDCCRYKVQRWFTVVVVGLSRNHSALCKIGHCSTDGSRHDLSFDIEAK